ncbi:MAG: radical SAM protein [Clostridium sp.]
MKEYFRLYGHVFLESGDMGACLYNILDGSIISLSEEKKECIVQTEKNIKLSEIKNLNYEFYDKLKKLKLGAFYNEKIYIEKFKWGLSKEMKKILKENHKINILQLEVTTDCNLNCKFCEKDSEVLIRKTGCNRKKEDNRRLIANEYKDIISQVIDLQCNIIEIYGGEPFRNFGLIKDIVEFARSRGIENFRIYTNGTLINQEIIDFIKVNKVNLNIQVISASKEKYDVICDYKGAFDIINTNINMLLSESIEFTFTYMLFRDNERDMNRDIEYYKAFGKDIQVQFIYPKPFNAFYSKKIIPKIYDYKSKLINLKLPLYEYLQENNCCLGNKIAVLSDGDISTCIMSKKLTFANYFNERRLHLNINNKYEQLKYLSKDKIEGCNKCQFRYGCLECRAIEIEATGKLNGMEYCSLLTRTEEVIDEVSVSRDE